MGGSIIDERNMSERNSSGGLDDSRLLVVKFNLMTNGVLIVPPVKKSDKRLTDGDIAVIASRAEKFKSSYGIIYFHINNDEGDASEVPSTLSVRYYRRR